MAAARRRAMARPRVYRPTSTTSAAPRLRSTISWAIRVCARRRSPASSTLMLALPSVGASQDSLHGSGADYQLIRGDPGSEGTEMSIDTALEQYFDAWNSHRPEAVPAALTDGGTYEDPTTGGPLSGDALTASGAGALAGSPAVHFEIDSVATTGDHATAQWRMQGTNTGPLPGGPATGGTIDLPGADFFTYDGEADKISSVVGYFDTTTMLRQLGLQAHITPADMEPVTKFGYGLRVDSGRDTVPGAFTVTWIEIDDEHHPLLVEKTTAIVMEQLAQEG